MSKFTKGLGVAVVALALLVSVAVPASALTQAQADAIVAALGLSGSQAATIQALVVGGSPAAPAVAFTRDLTIGSTGSDVVALQDLLIARGHLVMPAGVSKGYFGTLTQQALAKMQAANGISPAAGFFGPITRNLVNSLVAPAPTTPTTPSTPSTPGLSGKSGNIDDVTVMGDFSNEDVGEGKSDVEVLGLEIEADEGSDLAIENVRVQFSFVSPSGASNRFDRYAKEVSVWLDGKNVGSVDARDFSRSSSGVYRSTIQLSRAVIEAGETGELVIAVSAVSNLDSADEGAVWDVEVLSIRYSDASGAVLTYTDPSTPNSLSESLTFVDLATATNLEFKLGLDGTAKAKVVDIDSITTTRDVVLLNFTLRAQGSDMWIDELPVSLSSSATLTNVISRAKLTLGSRTFTENTNTLAGFSDTLTFDDLDFTLRAGQTVKGVIMVDVRGETNHAAGSTLTASITTGNRNVAIVEDRNGDNISNTNRTGSANGEPVAFYDKGIMVNVVSTKATGPSGVVANVSDTGTYEIKFEVTAFGDDMYILDSVATSGAAANTIYAFSNPTNITNNAGELKRDDTKSTVVAGLPPRFKINDGETARFVLTVVGTATLSSSLQSVQLNSVAWTASSTALTGTAYTFDLGINAKTSSINLIKR